MTDYEQETKQMQAASFLAIAASRLRDADDKLVAHGREIRDGNADRGMPADADGLRSIELCKAVAEAYAEMRDAEARFEEAMRDGA